MSNQSVTAVPHIHAKAIKAWADGAVIESRLLRAASPEFREWKEVDKPDWLHSWEYRVKPEPPIKVYPVTQMTYGELSRVWSVSPPGIASMSAIANAALRHAIDAGQVITALDHNNALATLDVSLTAARDARDMAIARALDGVYCTLVPTKQRNSDGYLATIIAKATP